MKDISYIDKIVKQHRTNLHKIAELSHVEFKTAKDIRDYFKVMEGYFPKATSSKARCIDCCYRNICIK